MRSFSGSAWSGAQPRCCSSLAAPSYGAMLVFRCLQGVGAALVLSCGAALVTSLYGEERRSRALGVYTMMMAFGWMLGPLLGGALTAIWDWPAVFWFRIPIAVAALLLLRGLPVSPPRQAGDRFDVIGGIALILGLVTMLLALNRVREFSAVWFALLSAAAFAAFVVREKRAVRPIIAIDILRLPGFALLNLVSVLANLAAFSVWLLVPYFLARVPGYALVENGAILATAAAGAVLAAPIAGRVVGRIDFRRAARDHGCGRDRCRSRSDQRVDGANADRSACRRAYRAGRRPWPVPAGLFGYRHGRTAAQGSWRRRQSRALDANARHGDCCFDRADGVRDPAAAPRLPRSLPADLSTGRLAGVCRRGAAGVFAPQDRHRPNTPVRGPPHYPARRRPRSARSARATYFDISSASVSAALCGVSTTFGWVQNGLSTGSGSVA